MSTARPKTDKLFHVDCKLSYTLLDDTHFLFMVHALHGMDQEVVDESLRLTPALEHQVHRDAAHGHRTLRVRAGAGPLTLRYRARVRLTRALPDLRATEAPIEALPHAVLTDLMPTRYCESDRLASAATKMFGGLGRAMRGAGGARLDPRAHRLPGGLEQHDDHGLRRVPAACGRVPRFRAPGRCLLPRTQHSGAPGRRLRALRRSPAGLSRRVRGLHRRPLGAVRTTGMADPQDLVRIAVGRDAGDVAFATLFGPVRTRLIRPEVEQVRSRRARR